MLHPIIEGNTIRFGERCVITFQRTLRIPDDGQSYPLPPGLGTFAIHRVRDYEGKVPSGWNNESVFISLFQREALWIGLQGQAWKPNAIQIHVGNINVISGQKRQDSHLSPKNYVVVPPQPWIDGINVGNESIRQFVAMPLGQGYTVEASITHLECFGGIQLKVYEPKPDLFPDHPPVIRPSGRTRSLGKPLTPNPSTMGIAAGGRITQKIYPDPHGIETWDLDNVGELTVHILNSQQYREVTGLEPSLPPIDAATYTAYNLPWFELYDETQASLDGAEPFADVKTIRDRDQELGVEPNETPSFEVSETQIKKIDYS